MDITLERLKKLKACYSALEWFEKQNETDILKIYTHLKNDESADLSWGTWLVTKLMSNEQNRKLAVFSAEIALHILEKRYPEHSEFRKSIETMKKYIKYSTEKNRNAVHFAAIDIRYNYRFSYFPQYSYKAAVAAIVSATHVIDAHSITYSSLHATCAADYAIEAAIDDRISTASMLNISQTASTAKKETATKILDYTIELLGIK